MLVSNFPYSPVKAALNPVSKVPDGFFKGLFSSINSTLVPCDCLVISGSMHISFRYSIPVKALIIQLVFPVVCCYKESIFLLKLCEYLSISP